jgi:hypothetical protein
VTFDLSGACLFLKKVFKAGGGDSPTSFVISKNSKRRHLTQSQKAAIAALALPFFEAEAKKRQREHGGTAPGQKSLSTKMIPNEDRHNHRDKKRENEDEHFLFDRTQKTIIIN